MAHLTRRDLLKVGAQATAGAAALALVPRPLGASVESRTAAPPIHDPDVKALALRAIDAARSAGAAYADVRLTHTREREFTASVTDTEAMHVGVRALVNGYWGFAASPVWNAEEMARLGQEAVHQAKTNALGKARVVELAPALKVVDGHWVMPVVIDPFEVTPFEILDFLRSLQIYAGRCATSRGFPLFSTQSNCMFMVQEKAFASTEGTYCTQRLYRSQGGFSLAARQGQGVRTLGRRGANLTLDLLTPAGVGWELYRHQDLRGAIERLVDELEEDMKMPVAPVEVGRYDIAVNPWSTAVLLDETLGRATELDRALGYEANAGGTSYLADPPGMVGRYTAGTELLTVTANRSHPGGAATVQWDDEGVTPEEFTLVKDGVLTDFQTTRESAAWLADAPQPSGPPRSHGCAAAPTAREAQLTHAPNLVMAPGREAADFDALVGTMKAGLAIKDLSVDMDFQQLNGYASGRVYKVLNGRRVARVSNAAVLFRAPELWKGLLALGGKDSGRRYGRSARKGEPPQETFHSVTVPPAVFKQLIAIDASRKA